MKKFSKSKSIFPLKDGGGGEPDQPYFRACLHTLMNRDIQNTVPSWVLKMTAVCHFKQLSLRQLLIISRQVFEEPVFLGFDTHSNCDMEQKRKPSV